MDAYEEEVLLGGFPQPKFRGFDNDGLSKHGFPCIGNPCNCYLDYDNPDVLSACFEADLLNSKDRSAFYEHGEFVPIGIKPPHYLNREIYPDIAIERDEEFENEFIKLS